MELTDIGAGEPTRVLRKSIMCSTEPALQAIAKIFLDMMLQHNPH